MKARGRRLAGLALGAGVMIRAALPAADRPVPIDGAEYQVDSWGIADGLPQSTVNDIVETKDGELWLATFGGLVRFDGVKFEVFDLATLEGLPSNRITAMVADSGSGLWLATQTGHLVHFVDRKLAEVLAPTEPGTEFVALASTPSGELIARDAAGRVLRIDREGHEVLLDAGGEAPFQNLLALPGGEIWAGRGGVLQRVDTGSHFNLPAVITRPVSDGRGGLWIGLSDGLGRFSAGVAGRVKVSPPLEGSVTTILPEGEERLWVGARSGPAELMRGSDGIWRQKAKPFDLPGGLGIRSMIRDLAGDLWIGTNGAGLFRVSRRLFSTVRFGEGIRLVTALASDGDGGAWIVASCRGLFHFAAHGKLTEVELGSESAPLSDCEHSIARDARNALWVRARTALFRVRRPRAGAPALVERLPVVLPDHEGALVSDPDGSLWISSRNGWVQHLAATGELTRAIDLGAELHSAALDPEGSLWLGSEGAIYRLRDGRGERFSAEQNVPPGAVRALLPGVRGGLLIGTYGGGLGWMKQGRIARLSTRQGLLDNSISGLLQDERGRIWILANQGISVLEGTDLEAIATGGREWIAPVHFGPERGVPEGNFGSPAAFADESGRLWFGTIDGAVFLRAAEFPRNRTPPRVVIESVEFDGRRVDAAPRLEVPPGTARIRVNFSASARTAPSRLRFRQRIEGLDRDWVEIGNQRSGGFTPPKPGEFRYQVEVRNEDGIWNEQPAEIALTVLPAWWQRTAVRIAAVVCIAGVLIGLHRLRLGVIDRRHRALLSEIDERQRAEEESARLRRELDHVTRLATAGELATSLAHEVNQPLAAIVSNAQAGRRFLAQGEAARAEVEQIFRDIARQGQRASEVIQRLREFLRKDPPRRVSLDVNELFRSVLPLVRREVEERKIELVLNFAPEAARVSGDRVQLQQVLINLIQNACEAMQSSPPPRRITLASRAAAGAVELSVADTGPGVPPEMAATLFEPFVSTKVAGMGIGLSICRSLVERHGGSLKAETAAGGGATFRVRLPSEVAAEAAS